MDVGKFRACCPSDCTDTSAALVFKCALNPEVLDGCAGCVADEALGIAGQLQGVGAGAILFLDILAEVGNLVVLAVEFTGELIV